MVVSERWKTVRACGGGAITEVPRPRGHPSARVPAPPYLLEGVAEALLTVQVIVNHRCKTMGDVGTGVRGAESSRELRTPHISRQVLGSTGALP